MSHSVFLGLSPSNIHAQRKCLFLKLLKVFELSNTSPRQVHQHLVLASRNIVYLSLFHVVVVVFLNNIYLVTTLLITILTFTWRENKNNVQERKKNTMLQHLQLIKPKKVLQIWQLFAKLQNKTWYNKNIRTLSYQLKVALHLHLFLYHF